MSEAPPPIPVKEGVSTVWVVLGILFIILWIIGHILWAGVSFIADVMANDSGRAPEGVHETLIFGMMGGQLLCGAAGVPAGLAFFWRRKRKLLLWLSALLFLPGALIQGGVLYSFFSSMR
ncbi:hypothetical protein [Prosthecobacter sp.]|uniref:hypothetical protein n=1 Tax=Prosthecobacter sp. TaxID=1965333 RepID=UPI003784A735